MKTDGIDQLLSHNVVEVIERDHLKNALESGKKLRIKLGIDPTSPDLHLGHAVVLRKLREFQDVGSIAVLVIGDFTGQIGDPSGRDKTRPPLTEKEAKDNMENYWREASKILDPKKTEVVYNKKWLSKLDGKEILHLLSLVSVQQIIEREDFKKRLSGHQSIRMHELLYPIMQAYDSVAIEADVELGGTDQTFNLLVGRDLMERMDMKPQDVLTVPVLEGLDGVKKMSKSLGNYIGLSDAPEDMFGKVMSVPDELVKKYFMLCTDASEAEIKEWHKKLGPKELKEHLGFEIVKLYHGQSAARKAQEHFEAVFSKKEIPEDAPELKLKSKMTAIDIVLASGAVKSKSEARRLIEQGGFEVTGRGEKDAFSEIPLKSGDSIRIGKRRFFKAKI